MKAIPKSRQQAIIPEKLAMTMERSRQLVNAALEQVSLARELRETSENLRQTNKDFRDFLREQRLLGFSLYERLMDEAIGSDT
ncbi:MAG TPA: hypothetical protein VJN48_02480 [Terriglobales bacterium]|nr:hypothetical protein [Terriglobales bacterium]